MIVTVLVSGDEFWFHAALNGIGYPLRHGDGFKVFSLECHGRFEALYAG